MRIELKNIAEHPQYIEQVARWYQSQWGDKYPTRTLDDWKNNVYTSKDQIPVTLISIDTSSKPPRVVGTVALHYQGLEKFPKDSVWLTALYVNPADRRKGIGTDLLVFAEKCAQKLGITNLILFTYGEGKIYKNKDWEINQQTTVSGKTALIMKKQLSLTAVDKPSAVNDVSMFQLENATKNRASENVTKNII